MRKIGRWSLKSSIINLLCMFARFVVSVSSFKVLEWVVILVGIVINGCNPKLYKWSMKLFVSLFVSCCRRSTLKSPHIYIPFYYERFYKGYLWTHWVVLVQFAFLPLFRVICREITSAQLSIHLDTSGRNLCCRESLMYSVTPPPFLFVLEHVNILYPSMLTLSLSLSISQVSDRAITSKCKSKAVML